MADDGWRILDTESFKIDWDKGVTAAIWAAILATVLGVSGGSAVITVMGANVMGVITAALLEATVDVEYAIFMVPMNPTGNRIKWYVTPSGSSTTYGPYLHLYII